MKFLYGFLFFAFFMFLFVEANEWVCPEVCPYIYAPICGKNGHGQKKDFVSDCIMQVYNCKTRNDYRLWRRGRCDGSEEWHN